ncbi:MAG: FmdB family zinc ribbon protein [Anaerolineae bacterium]
MPIYEFQCNQCQHRFSQLFRTMHGSKDMPPVECPNCASTDTRRTMSSFAMGGAGGVDVGQVAAESRTAERQASVTSKEQIDSWRSSKSK